MKTDAGIHSHTLGRAPGVQLRRGRKDHMRKRGVKILMGKLIETADILVFKISPIYNYIC